MLKIVHSPFSHWWHGLFLRALLFQTLVRVNVRCITLQGLLKMLVVEQAKSMEQNPWEHNRPPIWLRDWLRFVESGCYRVRFEVLQTVSMIKVVQCFRLSKCCSWGILFFWDVALVCWVKSISHFVIWWHPTRMDISKFETSRMLCPVWPTY